MMKLDDDDDDDSQDLSVASARIIITRSIIITRVVQRPLFLILERDTPQHQSEVRVYAVAAPPISILGAKAQGIWGTEDPNGVQGQSPGRGSVG